MYDSREKVPSIESENKEKPTLSQFSKDLIIYMGSFFNLNSLGNFSQTSKEFHALSKPQLATAKARRLLTRTINGNPEGVEKLFKITSPDSECIALKRVAGVEECSRSWRAVSPLEFAAWAGDTDLVNMLLGTVPKEEQPKALEQLLNIQKNGLEGRKYLESYYSLIDSYDEFIAKFDSLDEDQRNDFWIRNVGQKQYMLPLVGLQQMCDGWQLDPTRPKYPLARIIRLYHGSLLLPLSSSGLGVDFALYKGDYTGAERGEVYYEEATVFLSMIKKDVSAFRRLCDLRTKELAKIIDQLQTPSVEIESSVSNP